MDRSPPLAAHIVPPADRPARRFGVLIGASGLVIGACLEDLFLGDPLTTAILYVSSLLLTCAQSRRTVTLIVASVATALLLLPLTTLSHDFGWISFVLQRLLIMGSVWSAAALCWYCLPIIQSVRDSAVPYDNLLENLSDTVICVSGRRIVLVNPAGLKLLGADSPVQLLDRSFSEFIPSRDRNTLEQRLEIFRSNPGSRIDQILLGVDGVEVETEIAGNWLLQHGRPMLRLIIRDLRPLRRVAETLRRTECLLTAAQRYETVARLSAGVAHDFNNVLCIVGSVAEQLDSAKNLDDEQRCRVQELTVAVQWSAQLARRLAQFSRGRLSSPETLSLNSVIGDLEPLLHQFSKSHTRLELSLAFDLGKICADRAQMAQAVLNLAMNGVDAMPNGGVVRIETRNVRRTASPVLWRRRPVSTKSSVDESVAAFGDQAASAPDWYVSLTVSDTGRGLPAEALEKLFEPYFTTKAPGRGAGLGLPTVSLIVQQNHGFIEIESEVGVGTKFHLYFPRLEQDPEQQACAEPESRFVQPHATGQAATATHPPGASRLPFVGEPTASGVPANSGDA